MHAHESISRSGIRRLLCLSILTAVCALSSSCIGQTQLPQPGTNLIPDPGFELGLDPGWRYKSSPDPSQVISGGAHTGDKRLQISGTIEGQNALVSRDIPCIQGCNYKYSVWVRSSGFAAPISPVEIRFFDSKWDIVGNVQSRPVANTTEWQNISGDTGVIPLDAVHIRFTLILRKTGTLDADDLSIAVEEQPIANTLLRYPNYRNTIYPGMARKMVLGVELVPTPYHAVSDTTLNIGVYNSSGQRVQFVGVSDMQSKTWQNIGLSLSSISPGAYRVKVDLLDRASKQRIAYKELPLTIAGSTTPLPKVYIDEQNRCIVGGKPFFPLGCYISISTSTLDRAADAGYNCLIFYHNSPLSELQTFAQAAQSRNVKLLFPLTYYFDNRPGGSDRNPNPTVWTGGPMSVVKGLVDTFKSNPAVLGWYLNDELPVAFLDQLNERYAYLSSADPNHPVYQVLGYPADPRPYMTSTDALGLDYYPVMFSARYQWDPVPIDKFGQASKLAWLSTMGSRAMWMVPECSSCKPDYSGRQPTREEILCEAYQALVSGARGLVFFNLSSALNDGGEEQYQVIKQANTHLKELTSIALADDAAPTQQATVSDTRAGIITRMVSGTLYILAVNPSYQELPVTVTLGGSVLATSVVVSTPGQTQRTIRPVNRVFADKLEPLGVRLYRVVK